MIEREKISSYLNELLDVITLCINNTEHKKDVRIYQRDYLFIENFLSDISNPDIEVEDILNHILEDQTAKIMTEYWREGKYGEMECFAFYKLRDKVRLLIVNE